MHACSYWSKSIGEQELLAAYKGLNTHAWTAQKDAGIDVIGVDGTMYDQVHPSSHYHVKQRLEVLNHRGSCTNPSLISLEMTPCCAD